MRFVTDLSKGILGKPDSVEVWEQIISSIPDETFLKKDLKILNVACGHCTEADIIVKRMLALGRTLSDIKDSVCVLDKYSVFTKDALRKGYTNVFKCDFLEWETDMKFDVIIGNPPYQGQVTDSIKLWNKFCLKAIDIVSENGYIAMVTPQTVINGTDSVIKANKPTYILQKWLQDNTFVEYNDTANEHFDVGIPICYWIAKNTKSSNTTKFVINNNTYNKDYIAGEKVVTTLSDTIIDAVIHSKHEKYKRVRTIFGPTGHEVSDVKTDEFKYKVVWNSAKADFKYSKVQVNTQYKLALNNYKKFTKSKDNFIITNLDVSPSYFSIVDSVENLEKLTKLWTTSKLFQYVAGSFLNTKGVFLLVQRQSVLPILDLDVEWTDELLYAEFELSKEQIDHIESHVN